MGKLKQGTVTVVYPDSISLPEKAGKLSADEVARVEKARRGVGLTCEKTAEALKKYKDRVKGSDVDPAKLEEAGAMAEDIDVTIADVEHALMVLKQANILLDGDAHRMLRKVLAAVRSAEKFDPKVTELFPHLIGYFASNRGAGGNPAPAAGGGGTPG